MELIGQMTVNYRVRGDGLYIDLENLPRDLFEALPAESECFVPDDNRFPTYWRKSFKRKGIRLSFYTLEDANGHIEGVLDPEPRGLGLPGK